MAPDELFESAVSHRLRVWSWWGHDALSGRDLAFVVAVSHRDELTQIAARLPLPAPRNVKYLFPTHAGFVEAMEAPSKLRWMALDEYAAGSRSWLREGQLIALRVAAPTRAERRRA